jgi:ankyrin repeat protein
MHTAFSSLYRCLLALLLLISCFGLQVSHEARAASAKDFWTYVANDNVAAVQELLSSGFDPNSRSPNQQTGLIQAARDGAWQVFDLLLANAKTNINAANQYGETPLMYVALLGDLPRVQQMVSRGAKVNKEGWTALHYAALNGVLIVVSGALLLAAIRVFGRLQGNFAEEL